MCDEGGGVGGRRRTQCQAVAKRLFLMIGTATQLRTAKWEQRKKEKKQNQKRAKLEPVEAELEDAASASPTQRQSQ